MITLLAYKAPCSPTYVRGIFQSTIKAFKCLNSFKLGKFPSKTRKKNRKLYSLFYLILAMLRFHLK